MRIPEERFLRPPRHWFGRGKLSLFLLLAATETLSSKTVSNVPDFTVSVSFTAVGLWAHCFRMLPGYWELLVIVKCRKQQSRLQSKEPVNSCAG